jgi:hypothetical protein
LHLWFRVSIHVIVAFSHTFSSPRTLAGILPLEFVATATTFYHLHCCFLSVAHGIFTLSCVFLLALLSLVWVSLPFLVCLSALSLTDSDFLSNERPFTLLVCSTGLVVFTDFITFYFLFEFLSASPACSPSALLSSVRQIHTPNRCSSLLSSQLYSSNWYQILRLSPSSTM